MPDQGTDRASADEKRIAEIERSIKTDDPYSRIHGGNLDTLRFLLTKLREAREATAPNPMPLIDAQATAAPANWTLHPLLSSPAPLDGDWEAQLREVTCSADYEDVGGLFDGGPFQFVYLDDVKKLLARARQQAALAALANAAEHRPIVISHEPGDLITEHVECSCGGAVANGTVPYARIWGDHVRALPVEGTSLAEHDAALVAGAYQAMTCPSVIARAIPSLTPADAQRWLAEFERKVRQPFIEAIQRICDAEKEYFESKDPDFGSLHIDQAIEAARKLLRSPSPAGEPLKGDGQ
jgi:hypothetical protein